MKIDIALWVAYTAILLLMQPSVALQYSLVSALLAVAVTWITQSKRFYLAFGWLKAHPYQAIALVAMVSVFTLLPFVIAPLLFKSEPAPVSDLPGMLAVSPVYFLWFWAFLAVGVRWQHRRVNTLVEHRLSERRGTASEGGPPKKP